MRRTKVLIFIFIILWFTAVGPFKYDETNQIKFLQERKKEMLCWNDTSVLSRKVMSHGKSISIYDFFQVSSAKILPQWPIKKYNVNKVTNIMLTVLSCEFSDISYYINEYMENHVGECKKSIVESVENTQNNTGPDLKEFSACIYIVFERLKLLPTYISQMILTLIDFMKYRINSEYSEQNILKMLLSWYLGLKNVGMDVKNVGQNEIENYIEIHMVIGLQMKNAIKEFQIQNCRHHKEQISFSVSLLHLKHETLWSNVNTKLSTYFVNENVDGENGLINNLYILEGVKNTNVLNDVIKHARLLQIIKKNLNTKVKWNNEDLSPEEIFNKYITHSTNIQTVLMYEQSMLDLMTELVYGKALGELEPILNDNYNAQMTLMFSKYSEIINNVVLNSDSSQTLPLVFVNNMKIFAHELSTVAQYLKSPKTFAEANNHFHRIRLAAKIITLPEMSWDMRATALTEDNEPNANGNNESAATYDLRRFLDEFILEHINNTYLSRTVIDTLRDSSHAVMAGMFDNAFDHNQTTIIGRENKNEKYCSAVGIASRTSFSAYLEFSMAKEKLIKSGVTGSMQHKEKFVELFRTFNEAVLKLKTCVVNLLLAAYEDEQFFDGDNRLRKIFLTFMYNKENVNFFDDESQFILLDDEGISNVLNFLYVFQSQIKTYLHLVCANTLSPIIRDFSDEVRLFLTEKNRALNDYIRRVYGPLVKDISDTGITPKDFEPFHATLPTETDPNNDDIIISQCINVVKSYNEFVSNNSDVFHGSKIRFYWKETEISVKDLKNTFNDRTFNLQDVIEYQLLTINWIISSVFSLFINILDRLIDSKLKRKNIQPDCFIRQCNYFFPLLDKHLMYKRTTFIFKSFNKIILYDGYERDYLENFKRIIKLELKYFGIVLTSLPSGLLRDVLKNVSNVSKNVTVLEDSKFSSLLELVGLKQILTESPYSYT